MKVALYNVKGWIIQFCGLTKNQQFQSSYGKNIGQTQIEELFRKNLTKVKFIKNSRSVRTIIDYASRAT